MMPAYEGRHRVPACTHSHDERHRRNEYVEDCCCGCKACRRAQQRAIETETFRLVPDAEPLPCREPRGEA